MAKSTGGFSWKNDIPTDSLYPRGYFELEVVSGTATIGETRNGYKEYRAETRIRKPKEYAGQPYFVRFCVGWEEDPTAKDPNTWKRFGATRLAKFLGGIDAPDGYPDDIWEEIEGNKCIVLFGTRTEKKGDYAGTVRQTEAFHKLGEREPGLMGDDDATASRRPKREPPEDGGAAQQRGRAPAPPPPDEDDDVDETDAPPPRRARR